MLKCKAGLPANKSWSKNKLSYCSIVVKSELLSESLNFFRTAFTVPMLKFNWICMLLYLGSIRKILHSPYCIYFRCSKFKQMFRIHLLFIFLSKHSFYQLNFLEHAFQIKIKKLSIGSFIEIIELYVSSTASAFNKCVTAGLASQQSTLRNHLNLYKVIA